MKAVTIGPMAIKYVFGSGFRAEGIVPPISVKTGDTIRVMSHYGTIDFGIPGIAPVDADGLDETPVSTGSPLYPAPTLRKFSLVCYVSGGYSKYYQGGKDKTFVIRENGYLILTANTASSSYVGGYWVVVVQRVEGVEGEPSTPEWLKVPDDWWNPSFWADAILNTRGTSNRSDDVMYPVMYLGPGGQGGAGQGGAGQGGAGQGGAGQGGAGQGGAGQGGAGQGGGGPSYVESSNCCCHHHCCCCCCHCSHHYH